jgi:hypothetical protein
MGQKIKDQLRTKEGVTFFASLPAGKQQGYQKYTMFNSWKSSSRFFFQDDFPT